MTQQTNEKKSRNHKYKVDYSPIDMYKDYKKIYGDDAVDYKTYRRILKETNQLVVDSLFDNHEYKMPFGMGTLSIRKRKINIGNFKKLRVDYGQLQRTGEVVRHLNLHTDMFYYMFYWTKGKVCNIGAYKLKMVRDVTRRMPSELEKGKDYFEAPV